MATNKVVYNGKTLIDLSSDTVAASTLVEGITAHDKTGKIITGELENVGNGKYIWKKHIGKVWDITTTKLGTTKPSDSIVYSYGYYVATDDGYFLLKGNADSLGNGYSYIKGKGADTHPKSVYHLINKYSYSSGFTEKYYRLDIGNTYTEGKGSFIGYVSSDDSSAYPEDGLKDGYYYVKLSEGTSSGSSNNNCEAYLVDVTNPTVSFKTISGAIKAYGYAYETTKSQWGGSTTTTMYAFNGTNYYKSAAYGSPTATNITLGISGGKLTGLPNLTSGTLLVTKGI